MASIQDITYKIVKLDPSVGTILVKYMTNAYSDGLIYPLDLPIENGSVPTGDALVEFIMFHAPVGQLTDAETQKAFLDARRTQFENVDLSEIRALAETVAVQSSQPVSVGSQTL
jgi:hypothetical protein